MVNRRQPHALVIHAGLGALGAARTLARAGVPVATLSRNFDAHSARTRFGLRLRIRENAGPALIEDLLALRHRFEAAPVLIPTCDDTVETLAKAADRLIGPYRCVVPDPTLLPDLMDKARFQRLAERLGFPVPRAVVLG